MNGAKMLCKEKDKTKRPMSKEKDKKVPPPMKPKKKG